jgi:NADH-quinone oxidoreductase subunit J
MDLLSQIGYGLLAIVVVFSAVGMILSRNAVYSALLLAINFVTVAIIYLVLGAPFIALVQITVYAGSIMILFLFVIMLLGAERLSEKEPIKGQRSVGIILGLLLAIEAGVLLVARGNLWTAVQIFGGQGSTPEALGQLLFTQYPLIFIATGFILLVATMGAVLLTRGEGTGSRENLEGKE